MTSRISPVKRKGSRNCAEPRGDEKDAATYIWGQWVMLFKTFSSGEKEGRCRLVKPVGERSASVQERGEARGPYLCLTWEKKRKQRGLASEGTGGTLSSPERWRVERGEAAEEKRGFLRELSSEGGKRKKGGRLLP